MAKVMLRPGANNLHIYMPLCDEEGCVLHAEGPLCPDCEGDGLDSSGANWCHACGGDGVTGEID